MQVKINNQNNTYKNRHADVHTRKVGRPKIEYPTQMANSSGFITPEDVLKDFEPIRRIDEETGEVIDL